MHLRGGAVARADTPAYENMYGDTAPAHGRMREDARVSAVEGERTRVNG